MPYGACKDADEYARGSEQKGEYDPQEWCNSSNGCLEMEEVSGKGALALLKWLRQKPIQLQSIKSNFPGYPDSPLLYQNVSEVAQGLEDFSVYTKLSLFRYPQFSLDISSIRPVFQSRPISKFSVYIWI